jgi:hypothetical protein
LEIGVHAGSSVTTIQDDSFPKLADLRNLNPAL